MRATIGWLRRAAIHSLWILIAALLTPISELSALTVQLEEKITLPTFISPYSACIDDNGNLYIVSSEDEDEEKRNLLCKVYKLSGKGEVLDTIIIGEGYGVKEAKLLRDIIYTKGKVMLSDYGLRRISIFDTSGIFLSSFLCRGEHFPPSFICSDGKVVLINAFKIDKQNEKTISGWVQQIYSINGKYLGSECYLTIPYKSFCFLASPAAVNWRENVAFLLLPPELHHVYVYSLTNKKFLNEIEVPNSIISNRICLFRNRYLLIASIKPFHTNALPPILARLWHAIKYDELIMNRVKELEGESIFKVHYPEVGYFLDIYDLEENNFILRDHPLEGELFCSASGFFSLDKYEIMKFRIIADE